MATIQNVLNFARAQSQTDSNGLTDANGIIWANEAELDLHRRLIDHNIDASSTKEAYCDGKVPTNDGDGSTFLYPSDLWLLKAIEVNFSNTDAGGYVRADQCEVSNLPGQNSFSYLRKQCSKLHPKFDDRGDWYEIFPAFGGGDNLSQAIRIFYFAAPTEYTATSDTINYPESMDYRVLGWRVAANYLYSLGVDKIPLADKFITKYEERVKQFISTLGRGAQQPLQTTPLQITGWEF